MRTKFCIILLSYSYPGRARGNFAVGLIHRFYPLLSGRQDTNQTLKNMKRDNLKGHRPQALSLFSLEQ
ncbi:hypothetical protein K070079E91_40160 [Eisenbergiella porci]